jgi:hypothetical protein
MFEINEEHFPVVFSFFAGQVDGTSAEEISAKNLELIQRAAAEDKPFFFFINALNVETVTPPARKLLAEWDAGLSDEQAELMAARVVMLDNLVVRGAISAMSWFSPRMRALVGVKSFDEGVTSLRESMREHGAELDDATVEAIREFDAAARARYRGA